jgi:hypothetical protein
VSLEKLLCMNIAAQLTSAAVGGQGGLPTIDPTIQDSQIRAKNLEVWEVQRIFYSAVVGALNDTKSWPEPNVTSGSFIKSLIPQVLETVTPLLSGNPALAGILSAVQGLTALVPKAPAAPLGPIPDPGSSAK